jgi:hypothetical protein
MVMDVDGKAYRLNSGLFVASRYPLEAPEFVRYHICTNEDVLAGKGVLACTVVVGETSTGQKIKITIFTTHAQVTPPHTHCDLVLRPPSLILLRPCRQDDNEERRGCAKSSTRW